MSALLSHVRSNAVAYLALFVALGGTSYAAVQLPKNSVGSAQIKNNAVTSSKVKNGSLVAADLTTAARAALKGQKGDTGATGATGPKGDAGPATPAVIGDGSVTPPKLGSVPYVELQVGATTSMGDGSSMKPFALSTEVSDKFAIHEPGAENKVTAPISGVYAVAANVVFLSNANGYRELRVQRVEDANDRPISVRTNPIATSVVNLNGSGLVTLNAGQQIEMVGAQTSGGSLSYVDGTTNLKVVWVAPKP